MRLKKINEECYSQLKVQGSDTTLYEWRKDRKTSSPLYRDIHPLRVRVNQNIIEYFNSISLLPLTKLQFNNSRLQRKEQEHTYSCLEAAQKKAQIKRGQDTGHQRNLEPKADIKHKPTPTSWH